MRIYKRGSVYWYELVYNGQRYQKSTKSSNRRAANEIASAFHTALAKGDVGIVERKPIPAFDAAMKSFLKWSEQEHHAHPRTALRYKVSSAALLRFFKKMALDKITPEDVERYKTERAAEKGKRTDRKLRPATVNRELACLRAMYNYVLKGDVLLRNPVSRVKFLAEDNQQDRVLNYTEQRRYLAVATPVLQDVAGLILETGMRPEEVYTLRVSSVDLDAGYLRILKGKTPAAKRRIDLTPEAKRILRERIKTVKAGYLFPHESDAKKPIPKVNNAHDRAVAESKVTKFRLYDLRHTWATRAAEAGIDLVTLAAMMGHSRVQMVMRYAHPTQKHQSTAMETMAKHVKAARIKEELAEKKKTGEPMMKIVKRA